MSNKKMAVSEFISDKKIDKIQDIISKSDDIELNYDRIEMLLDKGFKVIDLGTNRIVFKSRNKKHNKYIFKVAGDPHGIEANYREFYNGDLDKRLTFSFAISKNGVFVVQERVTRLIKDDLDKLKKGIRKMLDTLSRKLLLVDCKLSNFKNFGIRKNGELCLLDHGDTVPLPKYQGQEIVNADEESFISLRCKKIKDIARNKKNLEPCKGKLEYSKNYDSFVCKKCGAISSIHDAYREFYGDKRIKIKGPNNFTSDNFDPEEWKEHIKQYCIETMSHADNKNNKKGEMEMLTKTINEEKVVQIKGFWLPAPKNMAATSLYNSVRLGKSKPQEYLKAIGVKDIELYKVRPSEHVRKDVVQNTNKQKAISIPDNITSQLKPVADKLVELALETGLSEVRIEYIEISKYFPNVDFSNMSTIGNIRTLVSVNDKTCGVIYTDKEFSIRIKSPRVKIVETTQDSNKKQHNSDPHRQETIKQHQKLQKESEEVNNSIKDELESGLLDYINDEILVENLINDIEEENNNDDDRFFIITQDELDDYVTHNGFECIAIGRYMLPTKIVKEYITDDGLYKLPKRIKSILKSKNLPPKRFKITNETIDDYAEDGVEMEESLNSILLLASHVKKIFDTLHNLACTSNEKDKFGYSHIPAEELVTEIFTNNNLAVPENVATIKELPDERILVSVNDDQLDNLYTLLSSLYNSWKDNEEVCSTKSFSMNAIDRTIGICLGYNCADTDSIDDKEADFAAAKELYEEDPDSIPIPLYLAYDENEPDELLCDLNDSLFMLHSEYREFLENFSNDEYEEIKEETFNKNTVEEFISYFKSNYDYITTTILYYLSDIIGISDPELLLTSKLPSEVNRLIEELNMVDIEVNDEEFESDEDDDYEYEDDSKDDEYEGDLEDDEDNDNIIESEEISYTDGPDVDSFGELLYTDLEDGDEDGDEYIHRVVNNVLYDNKEEDDLLNSQILEAINALVETTKENSEILKDVKEEIIKERSNLKDIEDKLMNKINVIDYNISLLFQESSEETCETPCEEEASPKEVTINDGILNYELTKNGFIVFESKDINDKVFIVKNGDKYITMTMNKLINDVFNSIPDQEQYTLTITKLDYRKL